MALHDLIPSFRSNNRPLPLFTALQEEMNKVFDNFNNSGGYLSDWISSDMHQPAVNITEKKDSFQVEAELPGLAPEAVDVSVTNGSLLIKGERKEENEEKNKDYIRRECSYGSFYRQVPLPESANSDKAEAFFKNGILTVTIPKKPEAVQNARKLQIKSK